MALPLKAIGLSNKNDSPNSFGFLSICSCEKNLCVADESSKMIREKESFLAAQISKLGCNGYIHEANHSRNTPNHYHET